MCATSPLLCEFSFEERKNCSSEISSPSSRRSRKPRGPPHRCRPPRGTPAECYLASTPPARSWPCAVDAAPSGLRPPAGTLTDRRQEEDVTNTRAENREYVIFRGV